MLNECHLLSSLIRQVRYVCFESSPGRQEGRTATGAQTAGLVCMIAPGL